MIRPVDTITSDVLATARDCNAGGAGSASEHRARLVATWGHESAGVAFDRALALIGQGIAPSKAYTRVKNCFLVRG